jgi:predicted Zn-dependent protease
MSKARLALRLALIALILVLLWMGYYLWRASRPNYYFDRARADIKREDFVSARINLVNLVRRHPENAEAFELLSDVILQEARKNGLVSTFAAQPAAVAPLERAAQLRPHDEDLQRRLLNAYLQLRHFHKAAVIAENIYKENPRDGDAHFALTWRAVKAGNHEMAETLFAESSGITSRFVFHEYALRLMHYTDIGDQAKMSAALVEAAQTADRLSNEELRLLAPHDREVMLQILLIGQEQSLQTDNTLQFSKLLMQMCERLEAAKLFDPQVLAKYASQSQALLNGGLRTTTLSEKQRWMRRQLSDKASELTEKAIAEKGLSSAVVYWTGARKLVSEGKYEDALKVLTDGIQAWEKADSPVAGLNPDEELSELHLLVAKLLISQQRYEEANKHLLELEGQEKYEGWGNLLRGDVLLRDGRLEEALEEYMRAQKKLDSPLLIHTSLARTYLGLEDWPKAIPHLEAMLTPDEGLSEDERAWRRPIFGFEDRVNLDLLRARLHTNQWDAAQKNLLALRDTELASQAWHLAISHLWQAKQRDKAIAYLARAREKFPDDIDLLFLEAGFMQQEGRSLSAETLFDDFVAANRNDPIRRLAQARWLIRDGKPEKAMRVLNAVERYPDLSDKARNTLRILEIQSLIELRQHTEASAKADTLIADEATRAAGYLLKAVIAWNVFDEEQGADYLARAQELERRALGQDKVIMQVRTRRGEIIGVAIQNAYYW